MHCTTTIGPKYHGLVFPPMLSLWYEFLTSTNVPFLKLKFLIKFLWAFSKWRTNSQCAFRSFCFASARSSGHFCSCLVWYAMRLVGVRVTGTQDSRRILSWYYSLWLWYNLPPGESSEIQMRLLKGFSTLYTRFTFLSVRVHVIGAMLVCLSITKVILKQT